MRAAPEAMLDDGLLDVIILERVSKLRFLTRILPKVFSGAHVREPSVKSFRAQEVSVSCDRPFTMYADGDPIGELPVRVRALKGAITMLLPRAGAEQAFSQDSSPTATASVAGPPDPSSPAPGGGAPGA